MPRIEKKRTDKGQRFDTAIIVAIMGLIGTLVVGILNSPLLIKLLDRVPASPTPARMNIPPDAGQLLFSEDFEENAASGFAFETGKWEIIKDGSNYVLQGIATESDTPAAKAYFGSNDFSNGIIEFRVKFLQPFGLYVDFHYQAETGGHVLHLSPTYQSLFLATNVFENGRWNYSVISSESSQSFTFQPNSWYKVQLESRGDEITLNLDGNRILSVSDSRFDKGRIRFALEPDTILELDDVMVWSLKP